MHVYTIGNNSFVVSEEVLRLIRIEYNNRKKKGYPSFNYILHLANVREVCGDSPSFAIDCWLDFIDQAFIWSETREGHNYWENILDFVHLTKEQQALTLPENLSEALYG